MSCICPRCGTEFEPAKIYTIPEIAQNLGVSKGTVKSWMFNGSLQFRLWARSSCSIRRVVLGADMMKFIDQRFPLPDPDGEHLAQRLWNWTVKNGAKGQRVMREGRRLTIQAQQTPIDKPGT